MRKTEIFKRTTREASRTGDIGYLAVQDAIRFVQSIRSEATDLIFLDPPFNLKKEYKVDGPGSLEDFSQEEYQEYLLTLIGECQRVLKDGGSLFLYHLPLWASRLASALERSLEFRHWIAISMKNGFARGNRLYPAHYALLYFTKGPPSSFQRPKMDPPRCRHCGEYVRDYGGYRKIIDRKGINLSDVWDDVAPVRHSSNKHRSANQLPPVITDRVVRIAGTEGGWLLDPFVGTGTSLISAVTGGMRFVAADLSSAAIDVTRQRLAEVESMGHQSSPNSRSPDQEPS